MAESLAQRTGGKGLVASVKESPGRLVDPGRALQNRDMMDPRELAAREEIRELVARYNHHGDAGRIEALLDLFTDEAELEIREGPRYAGREQLSALFSNVTPPEPDSSSPPTRIWHHTSTLVIDVEDESHARGSCYFAVLTQQGLDHWGRYRDNYECVNGSWRFARRRVRVDGRIPGGWADGNLARLPRV